MYTYTLGVYLRDKIIHINVQYNRSMHSYWTDQSSDRRLSVMNKETEDAVMAIVEVVFASVPASFICIPLSANASECGMQYFHLCESRAGSSLVKNTRKSSSEKPGERSTQEERELYIVRCVVYLHTKHKASS